MAKVYIETTIPSYLVARRSRDLIVAAHQQITHEWWDTQRERFELFVSEVVLDELSGGDPDFAQLRMQAVADLKLVAFSSDVESLIEEYSARSVLTGEATVDLPHFAFAVAYNIDYLLTWNCKHIANGYVIRRLADVNAKIGRPTPVICTPQELMVTWPGGE